MPSAVRLREDYSAEELRRLARRSKDVNQSSAAKIGGMDRQTLRDWVHRFNTSGPEGLIDNWTEGPSLACRRSNWLSSRRSSRPVRIVRRTGSCAGGGSTSRWS
jgi:transposase-like protein